jgi:hypothetical protein
VKSKSRLSMTSPQPSPSTGREYEAKPELQLELCLDGRDMEDRATVGLDDSGDGVDDVGDILVAHARVERQGDQALEFGGSDGKIAALIAKLLAVERLQMDRYGVGGTCFKTHSFRASQRSTVWRNTSKKTGSET